MIITACCSADRDTGLFIGAGPYSVLCNCVVKLAGSNPPPHDQERCDQPEERAAVPDVQDRQHEDLPPHPGPGPGAARTQGDTSH